MRPRAEAWVFLAVAMLVALASPALAQGDRLPDARERWEAKSPEAQALLRDRYERLRSLSSEERAALEDRLERLQHLRESTLEALPPSTKERMHALPPEAREVLVREHVTQAARSVGRRMREKLPAELLVELEGASPFERMRRLREYRSELHHRRGGPAVEHLCQRLGIPPAEVEELRQLSPEERAARIPGLRRQEIRRRVGEDGLPPWLESEHWTELEGLSDEAFMEAWHASSPFGGFPGGGELPGRPTGTGVPGGPGRPMAPRTPGASAEPWGLGDLEHRGERPDPAWWQLRHLLHPRFEDRVALSHLDPLERERSLEGRIKERVLQHLEGHALLEPAELERLRSLDGPAFSLAVRELLPGERPRPRGSGSRPGFRGPRRR